MKNLLRLSIPSVLALVCCCAASLAAAEVIGSGRVASETRNVSGFHGVNLQGIGDVVITQGETEGLVIEAEDNVLPLIESTVGPNGVLRLGMKEHAGNVQPTKPVLFKLAVKVLDKLVLAGSGNIRVASLSGDHLHIDLPGSGDIAVENLKTGAVTAEINGSGNVKLAGEARTQKVAIDGSGNYRARELRTDDTSVEINGSGNGKVWANGALAVTINGSGEVGYRGSARLSKSINGSGEVHPLEGKND